VLGALGITEQLLARSWQTVVRAEVNDAGSGAAAVPLAISSTVSLVDMQPSESMRSKVVRVAARRARSQSAGPITASVVITTSMVASAGASMPAPLAIPPTVKQAPRPPP
jgi:hypothetical protein